MPDLSSTQATVDLTARPVSLNRLLRNAWGARRLIGMLARRDFYVRYRRASLGIAWAVLLPLVQALVLALVLGRVTRLGSSTEVPFPLFVITGMVTWSFFSGAISSAATSIVEGSGMSTKVYFPRLVLPTVSVASAAIGLVLNAFVVLGITLAFGESLRGVWLLPLALLLAVALTTAFALVLSVAYVYFRDVRYLLEATQRAWFYFTPIFYPLDRLGSFRPYVEANPATGMVELFRAATVGAEDGWITSVAWSCGWVVVLGVAGLLLHRRHDRLFTDLL